MTLNRCAIKILGQNVIGNGKLEISDSRWKIESLIKFEFLDEAQLNFLVDMDNEVEFNGYVQHERKNYLVTDIDCVVSGLTWFQSASHARCFLRPTQAGIKKLKHQLIDFV